MDLHEKEKMYQRLIIFTLLIGMVIYYFEKSLVFWHGLAPCVCHFYLVQGLPLCLILYRTILCAI